MGSAPALGGGVAGGAGGGRWRFARCFLSTPVIFFFVSFVVLGCFASLFAWFAFPPFVRSAVPPAFGCRADSEGSWSIGIFYGKSPFELKPIELVNLGDDKSAAWPVANPVITCATASDAGSPSNFVADPFLFQDDNSLYLFFETKNSVTMQGDIGVAKSDDKGVTWKHLGVVLDEEWHLSYPFVFRYHDQVYMLPESSKNGDLRLYRASQFPLQWTLDRVVMKRPLVDAVIFLFNEKYWLFGSDFSGFGTRKNGELEIWFSSSPLGPWKPHNKNPIYNVDKSFGARNGGRPFVYNNNLYRVGQDCGGTYGRRVHVFKVDVLNENEYHEVEVQMGMNVSLKGRNSWNGARHHHLDAQSLGSGEWVAVMDGDRVRSGDSVRRIVIGFSAVAGMSILVFFVGLLIGAIKCIVPLHWCVHGAGKRSDIITPWERERSDMLSSKLRRFCARLNRASLLVSSRIKPNTCIGRSILALACIMGVVLACTGVKYLYGGNGAQEPYLFKGHYSQFTLLTMTYDARLWNLKMYVKHYSRCSSVKEIVVIWNKGQPPEQSDLDSKVPVRIRVEKQNSLNNRFRVDPLISTRAVLELDDDIMMACNDVERGFKVWREHPDRLVGFYPRFIDGNPLKYRDERYARSRKGYNMILTGAAFMDSNLAFKMYWSEAAKPGRETVDKLFNCEDVLMNFLYANRSSHRTVEYVKPAWAVDTSKFSGAAISRNTQVHYQIRSDCLNKFSEIYGNLGGKWEFNGRADSWDA